VIALFNTETAAKKALAEAQERLGWSVLRKYGDLTEADIQVLVLDDKLASSLVSRVRAEVSGLAGSLVSRLETLTDRYDSTLNDLTDELERLQTRVDAHLSVIGAAR
jgi:type I restriction enzyme M protein